MVSRIFFALTITLLLILPATTQAQTRAANAAVDRARLQRIMDPSTDVEEFRREYASFLTELEQGFGVLLESEFARRIFERQGVHPVEQLASVREKLAAMKESELAAMKAGYARNLGWRDAPRALAAVLRPEVRDSLKAAVAPNVINAAGVTPDKCSDAFKNGDTNGDPRVSNTDISIATAAVIAAATIVDSLPDDFLTFEGHAAAAIVRGGLEGALLVLTTFKSISDDCSGDVFQKGVTTRFNTLDSSFTSLNSTVATLAKEATLTTLRDEVKQSIGAVQAGVTEINGKVDVKVSSRASQASVNTLQQTANTLDSKATQTLLKLDALAAQLQALREENLRLQIELNLLGGPRYNLAQFQMPVSAGGHLEQVHDIVVLTINNAVLAGAPSVSASTIETARSLVATGEGYAKVGAFKDAYAAYRTAYLLISVNPATRQP